MSEERKVEEVRGTIKWYSKEKGYGFVVPYDRRGGDVFVHQAVVAEARIPPHKMVETAPVVCKVEDNKGRLRATSIALASSEG